MLPVYLVDGVNVAYRRKGLAKAKSKEALRNLIQYQNLSDEEFEKVWEERQAKLKEQIPEKEDLETRIQEMMEDFKADYALDDLKFNDIQTLRALIRALLTLKDYEDTLYEVQKEGIGSDNIRVIDNLNKFISTTRKDISNLQDVLRISRKVRKEEREDSIESYIINLQDKADRFYKNHVFRAVCPECGMMLFDGWFLYPEEDNKIILECGRMVEQHEDDEAKKCTGRLEVTSKDLRELQDKYKDLFPEGL